MADHQILTADWRASWWAAGRDLHFLREVDPSFTPGRLSLLNRLLLRIIVLPLAYSRSTGRFLILCGGRRAGFLYARQHGIALSIETFGVESSFRRQGLGRALLEKAITQAREEALSFVTAAITPENIPAQALLGALGFRPYRPYRLEFSGRSFTVSGQGGWGLRELSAVEALSGYEKWQKAVVKAGDPWVADLVLDAHLRSGWKGNARHWVCLVGNEESGYLRLAGLRGKYQAYIASKPATWRLEAPLSWLKQAIEAYPSALQQVTVDLASAAQFEASQEIWKAAGFRVLPRERFLMILPLSKARRGRR